MWKKGDWCFFEFKLAQIERVEEGKVKSVSTGYISASCNNFNDRVFPLTKKNKLVSEEFERQSNKIHREGNNALNYPDIHHKLVEMWANACLATDNDVQNDYEKLREFTSSILNTCKSLHEKEVDGVRLFR